MEATSSETPSPSVDKDSGADQKLEALACKVLADRDIKEGILALQDRLRQLEMKLSDCTELYLKRRQKKLLKLKEARLARICNKVLLCSVLMIIASYLIGWLRGAHDPCTS